MREQIDARSPADVEGYQRFVGYAKEVFETGYTKLAETPFLRFSDMVKVAPKLVKLRADRSVYSTVAKSHRDGRAPATSPVVSHAARRRQSVRDQRRSTR